MTDSQDDHRRRKTFESDCQAYEIAAQDEFLSGHIPGPFRPCEIASVVEDGKSVAADYLLACCYAMEYIEGTAAKLRVVKHQAHITEALKDLHRAGIAHTGDASIFLPSENAQRLLGFVGLLGYTGMMRIGEVTRLASGQIEGRRLCWLPYYVVIGRSGRRNIAFCKSEDNIARV